MLLDMSLAAKFISVALSYFSIKGVSKTAKRLALTIKTEEQDARVRHSEVCDAANNVY